MSIHYKIVTTNDIDKAAHFCIINENKKMAIINQQLPFGTVAELGLENLEMIHIGDFEDNCVYLCHETSFHFKDYEFVDYRYFMPLPTLLFEIISRGLMVHHFIRRNTYCGVCQTKTILSETEICLQCPSCNEMYFASMDPCIIVAIMKGDQILLAHHSRHENPVFTVLAGYVELGETLENALRREVYEESKILVKNIRYIESQPWAMPNSLMMAFICDYESGTPTADQDEILNVDFFDINNLPTIPTKGSIARELIDYCINEVSKKAE